MGIEYWEEADIEKVLIIMTNLDYSLNILDNKTTIVVLIGAPASGKTMVLLRMTRFLEKLGYIVKPEILFRPNNDWDYMRMCKNFKQIAYSSFNHLAGFIDLMHINVVNNKGNRILQIVEIPGYELINVHKDCYEDEFFNQIYNTVNDKIWVFFFEQDAFYNQIERDLYSKNICNILDTINDKDKVILLLNKVDLKSELFNKYGRPIKKLFINRISEQYPRIFKRYKSSGLAKLLLGKYYIKTICFSSGLYYVTEDERLIWTQESDKYCSDLWNALLHHNSWISSMKNYIIKKLVK